MTNSSPGDDCRINSCVFAFPSVMIASLLYNKKNTVGRY